MQPFFLGIPRRDPVPPGARLDPDATLPRPVSAPKLVAALEVAPPRRTVLASAPLPSSPGFADFDAR